MFEALQWQIESYGKDEFLSKCHELIASQRSILGKLKKVDLETRPMLLIQFSDSLMSTQIPKDELNISGLESSISKLKLSPNRLAVPESSAENLKTPLPAPNAKQILRPKRPRKKILADY